ncbi:MAG: LacI family DNA-binding transcriptional regulator [Capsulimonadales bacterium]|nr:LacI family DNA-binding transcriptional regulator [Capsulimonadales bacterium]
MRSIKTSEPIQTGGNGEFPPNRAQEAFTHLTRLARDLGPNRQLPTVAELRERLDVSTVTLNRVLEQMELQGIIVRRHGVGLFVSPTMQRSIALVYNPHFFDGPEVSPFYRIMLEQIRFYVAEHDFSFSLHFSTPDDPGRPFFDDFLRIIEERRIQGVVGVGLTGEAIDLLTHHQVPVAGLNDVRIDMESLTYEATEYLIERGCQRIALLAPFQVMDTVRDGYRRALTANDRFFDEGLIHDARRLGDPEERRGRLTYWDQGYVHAQRLFGKESQGTSPDGIVSPSELFSQGIVVGLRDLGIAIGETVHVATHANEGCPVLAPWGDRIARWEVSPTELARLLLQELIRRMEGGSPESERPVHRARCRLPGPLTP